MFTLYSIAIFLHVAGALALFAALGIEWVFLITIRNTDNISVVKQWLKVMPNMGKIFGPAWLAILIPGFYMAFTIWGFPAWIWLTFVIIAAMLFTGMGLTGKRLKGIGSQIMQTEILNADIKQKLRDPFFILSISIRTALALEIILLMTIKPDTAGALISLAAAVIIGYLAQLGKGKKAVS